MGEGGGRRGRGSKRERIDGGREREDWWREGERERFLVFTHCLLICCYLFIRSYSDRAHSKTSYESYAPRYVPAIESFRPRHQEPESSRQIFIEREVSTLIFVQPVYMYLIIRTLICSNSHCLNIALHYVISINNSGPSVSKVDGVRCSPS